MTKTAEMERTNRVKVIGMEGCRLPGNLGQLLSGCVAVFSSKRLLEAAQQATRDMEPSPSLLPITPLSELIDSLKKNIEKGDCAVLASGDPLFFGIGRKLVSTFGRQRLQFHPALSAVQMACARFGIPWDDARIMSLHGRRDNLASSRILSTRKTIIFTDAENSPDQIAKRLLKILEGTLSLDLSGRVKVHVAEELNCPGERVLSLDLEETAEKIFSPLNIMIIEVDEKMLPSSGIGLMEKQIRHLRGLITKDETRAVTLHKLMLGPGQIMWDVGAGSGSVSLEAARLYPDITSFAVESDRTQQAVIRQNIRSFRLFNVIPVDGTAPEILDTLPGPHRVFVGGSKGRLKEIIDYCAHALLPGGIVVANAILESTSRDAPRFMEEAGLEVDAVSIRVTRGRKREIALNPITVIRGIKKGIAG